MSYVIYRIELRFEGNFEPEKDQIISSNPKVVGDSSASGGVVADDKSGRPDFTNNPALVIPNDNPA